MTTKIMKLITFPYGISDVVMEENHTLEDIVNYVKENRNQYINIRVENDKILFDGYEGEDDIHYYTRTFEYLKTTVNYFEGSN